MKNTTIFIHENEYENTCIGCQMTAILSRLNDLNGQLDT